ncbi:hypothetical protein [Corynebacterium tuscaniense]|uniref:hypothetical protein n=1 Tax=Corynebacterium tuscaniense TaxID=302449 RepID=UPI0012EC2BE0|nr:hypothetical protein [Corynebacterium tuscaniense]
MILAIITAEVAFWLCLFGGMFLRYALKLPKAGIVLLAATPSLTLLYSFTRFGVWPIRTTQIFSTRSALSTSFFPLFSAKIWFSHWTRSGVVRQRSVVRASAARSATI